MEFPNRGISRSHLRDFYRSYKRQIKELDQRAALKLKERRLTTREVCEEVLKPLTAALRDGRGGAWVEIYAAEAAAAAAEDDDSPSADVATIYVCHAWDEPFDELVAAVEAHDTMAQARPTAGDIDNTVACMVTVAARCRRPRGMTIEMPFTGSISFV